MLEAPDYIPKCCVCKKGALVADIQWGKRFKAMASEIANPLLLLRAFYSIFLSVVEKREKIGNQWQCGSCKSYVLYCENCKNLWQVAKALDHQDKVDCPHCNTKYYRSLG